MKEINSNKITGTVVLIMLIALVIFTFTLYIDFLLAIVVVICGFWVYFESSMLIEFAINMASGHKNPKLYRESILFGINTDPPKKEITFDLIIKRMYIAKLLFFIPTLIVLIIHIFVKSPVTALLLFLYIEITIYSILSSCLDNTNRQLSYIRKNDKNIKEKFRHITEIQDALLAGKRIYSFPLESLPEPPQINHQYDFMLGLYAMLRLEDYDGDKPNEENERKAMTLCKRLLENTPIDVTDELKIIVKCEYLYHLIIYDETTGEITALYNEIEEYLKTSEKDEGEILPDIFITRYAYEKLINKDETASETTFAKGLEVMSNLPYEDALFEYNRAIERVNKKA
jgi:hypothetical protein